MEAREWLRGYLVSMVCGEKARYAADKIKHPIESELT